VTLGTGFGAGIVIGGELIAGDNSVAGEAWLLRNRLEPERCADDGASIRSVRRAYAALAGLGEAEAPDPRLICEIALGRTPGDRVAAAEAFRRLGIVAGDAIAQALTLIDGLAVIGGGMAAAHPLFLRPLVEAVNGVFDRDGRPLRRLIPRAFNLEDPLERAAFLAGAARTISVPGSGRVLEYDALQRTGIGISRLGTTRAVAVGAYAFALRRLAPTATPFCADDGEAG
jgi:glucokinase